jgi:VWFA-related protein
MLFRPRRVAWFLSALSLLAICAFAQVKLSQQGSPRADSPADAQSPPAGTTIKVDVTLVSLPVTATDDYGRFVSTLKPGDLRLREDGVDQRISVFHSETMPVSVGIVVDTSGSMVNKLPQAIDALERFVRTIQPDDDVFLMRFSTNVQLLLDFTNDRDRFDQAARKLRAGGSTRLYDALAEALDKVRQGRHQKKAIVLITDGEDTASQATFNEIQQQARASEVLAYCIGIGQRERSQGEVARGGGQQGPSGGSSGGSWPSGGSQRGGTWPGGSWPGTRLPLPLPLPIPLPIPGGGGRYPGGGGGRVPSGGGGVSRDDMETVDMRVLEAIADATGGRAYHLERADGGGEDSIEAATDQISAELRNQYMLGYYSSNSTRDGSFRQIQLSALPPGVHLRYRRGYYAPRG